MTPNYGMRRGIAEITVVEARGLKSCNFIRSMDPYARVTINETSKDSGVHDNGHKNPTWNEELPAFMVANVDADVVTIELWDKDSMSSDDLIAKGEVPMCDLANMSGDNTETGVLSVPLEPQGEIRVTCKFNLDEACAGTEARDVATHNYGMRRGITDIRVVEARGLKSCNFIRSMDPYARVTINETSKDSGVHDNGHKNPTWNEELPAFMVANVDADVVTIELWDKDSMSSDDLIAKGEVPMCDLANASVNNEFGAEVSIPLEPQGEIRVTCKFNLDMAEAKEEDAAAGATSQVGRMVVHAPPPQQQQQQQQTSLLGVDLDGDGVADVAINVPAPTGGGGQKLVGVDVDGDGVADVAVAVQC